MPRNVRPSFMELWVEGRASKISTGPRRLDGRMEGTFYLRENGQVSDTYCSVSCFSTVDAETGEPVSCLRFEVHGPKAKDYEPQIVKLPQ